MTPRLPTLRALRRRLKRSRLRNMFLLLGVLALFLTPLFVIYKPPRLVLRYLEWKFPSVVWEIKRPLGLASGSTLSSSSSPDSRGSLPSSGSALSSPSPDKWVALTLDDAPSAYTSTLLDLLAAHDAHATFFVIGGQVSGREDVLARIVREGHELGNHAMHDEPSLSLTDEELSRQLVQVEGMINSTYAALDIARPAKRFFRPGSGVFSTRLLRNVQGMGFTVALGSVYPHDAQVSFAGLNVWHVTGGVRDGSVVIMHDRRSWTVDGLKGVLGGLKRRGFKVGGLSQVMAALDAG